MKPDESEHKGPYRFVAEYTDEGGTNWLMVGSACQYSTDAYASMNAAISKLKKEDGSLPEVSLRFVGTLSETDDMISDFAERY